MFVQLFPYVMRTFKGFVCLSGNSKPAFDDIPFYRFLRIWANIFPTNLLFFCLIFYWCHITAACPGFCPWNSSSWDIHLHDLIHNILEKTSKFPFSTLVHLPQPQTHCFRFIFTSYKHFKLIIFQAEVIMLSPLLSVSWILLFEFIPLVSSNQLFLNYPNQTWVNLHIEPTYQVSHHVLLFHFKPSLWIYSSSWQ